MLEFAFIYTLGALGYGALELLWRGHTHWTMLLTGGACFALIYLSATRFHCPQWQKWILSSLLVTTVELLVGLLVNRVLGWQVWDYSALPFNLGGQICLRYSLYWLVLSIPAVSLCQRLQALLFL